MAKQEETKVVVPSIHERILAVMEECGYVQKDGYNSFSKYKYVTHDAVVEHVRPALIKHRVLAVSTMLEVEWPDGSKTNAGKSNNVCRVKMQTKFINADNPTDFIEVEFWGEAADTGDKAIFKAISGVKKYILTNTFALATGDDPEQDSPDYRQPKGNKTTQPEGKRADVVKLSLDEVKGKYTDVRKRIGLSVEAMGEAFNAIVPESKRKDPEAIDQFLYQMECRHSAWLEVMKAIEKWSVTGEDFDRTVGEIVGGDSFLDGNNWHAFSDKTLSAIADKLEATHDLPFGDSNNG